MNLRTRMVALGAVAALLASAGCSTQGSSSDANGPGVDEDAKVITVGNIGALSGPAAALGAPVTAGLETFWKAQNERGGIDGWKVEVKTEDSAYEPQQHVQIFNSMKSDVALLASFGSANTKAIQQLIDREKLVTTPQSFDSLWGADENLAPTGTPYSWDIANALDYVTEAGAKKPKVGVIYQNDEAGADAMRGFDAAEKEYGFEVAGRETFKPGDTDFTAQVQNLKSSGAEVVVVVALPSGTGPIVGAASSLGFKPKWVLFGPAFVEQLMTVDGKAGSKPTAIAGALDGALYTAFSAAWGDESVPAMSQMLEDQKKFAPDQIPSIYFTLGYAQGMLQAAILRKAIADGDLTREGILEAKRNVGEIDLGGLQASVTYAKGEPASRASDLQVIDSSQPGFLRVVSQDHLGTVAESLEVPDN